MGTNLLSAWPSGTGVNSGVFWYQSAVGPARMADGMSTTALFSERCLGNSSSSDLPADYSLVSGKIDSCESIGPTTPRFTEGVEWSGERWADGNIFYTRYHHIFSPNKPSCNFSTDDYTGSAVVTATSRHPGGVNLLNADGSARFVKETIDPTVWRALGTISGREVVNNAAF